MKLPAKQAPKSSVRVLTTVELRGVTGGEVAVTAPKDTATGQRSGQRQHGG